MLPEELVGHTEIETLLQEIHNTYNSLFIDTPKVFEYKGFNKPEDEMNFLAKIDLVYELIKKEVGDRCVVVNNVKW